MADFVAAGAEAQFEVVAEGEASMAVGTSVQAVPAVAADSRGEATVLRLPRDPLALHRAGEASADRLSLRREAATVLRLVREGWGTRD